MDVEQLTSYPDVRVSPQQSLTQVALFGTSADPPTQGHGMILAWLGEQFDQVAVWAADNPFKAHQVTLEHRQQMLRLLTQDLNQDIANIQVYPDLSHPHTVMTVQRARVHWPTATLTLVVGSDLLSQLSQWYRAQDILTQVRVLVIPRSGYPVDQASQAALESLGGQVAIAEIMGPAVSSTTYRAGGDQDVVTGLVQAYIQHHKLYPSKTSACDT